MLFFVKPIEVLHLTIQNFITWKNRNEIYSFQYQIKIEISEKASEVLHLL